MNDPVPEPGILTSYSELSTHRKCPNAWRYHYAESLIRDESVEVAVERDMGSWWQALLASEALERGRKLETLRAVPGSIKTVDGGPRWPGAEVRPFDVHSGADHWWARQSPEVHEVWIERIGGPLPQRLFELYSAWYEEWSEERACEEPLAVELRWTRELPKRSGDAREPVSLVGYIDEVYRDRKRNLVTVRDNKAHKTLASMTAVDDMMDSQLQLYAWGAAPIVRTWNVGPIRATSYDRARMTAPKSPVVTQSGTLSKSVTDYDVHTYAAWAKGPDGLGVPYPGRAKDGSGAGMYQLDPVVVDKLSTPVARSIWFQRSRVPLNVNIVRTHLRAAIDSADDLRRSRVRVASVHEAARNLGAGCRYCDYQKLCRAQMIGGPDGEYELIDFGLRRRPPRA